MASDSLFGFGLNLYVIELLIFLAFDVVHVEKLIKELAISLACYYVLKIDIVVLLHICLSIVALDSFDYMLLS